jgi:hypothetical protein
LDEGEHTVLLTRTTNNSLIRTTGPYSIWALFSAFDDQ